MEDQKLIKLIEDLREQVRKFRLSGDYAKGGGLTTFFTNVVEISCALTENGVVRKHQISQEQEYWFGGLYHMNFEFVGGPWENVYRFYEELVKEVELRGYFRS